MSHHVEKIKRGDFVLAVVEGQSEDEPTKKYVVQVTKVLESSYLAILVKDSHVKEIQFEVRHDQVAVNFGPKPPEITVAGTNLGERFFHRTDHDQWGPLYWSFVPDEKEKSKLHASFTHTYKFLKSVGLGKVTEIPLILEITHKKAKHLGYFKPSRNLSQAASRIRINPKDPTLASLTATAYVAAHEVGHLIQAHVLRKRPKLYAKWLELYHESLEPVHADKDSLLRIRDMLKESPGLSAFKVDVKKDEQDFEIAKAVFAYMRKAHGIRPYDIEKILLAETPEMIDAYWPRASTCFTRKLSPLVTEYATESVGELFAESFAFTVCDHKLPKKVAALMDDSLNKAAKSLPMLLKEIEDGASSDADE